MRPLSFYFQKLQEIVEKRETSSRVRFMIQDLIDLKASKWQPRRQATGPTTIDQIHKDAEREKRQQVLDNLVPKQTSSRQGNNNPDSGRKRSQRGGGGSQQGGGQGQVGEEGWTSVAPKTRMEKVDTSKLPNTRRTMDAENLQLGPGSGMRGMGLWGKGSGSRPQPKQASQDIKIQQNRFDIFGSEQSASMEQSGMSAKNQPQSPARGGSRSMGAPARSNSRGRRDRDERQSALEAVKTMTTGQNGPPQKAQSPAPHAASGPTASMPPPVIPKDKPLLHGKEGLKYEAVEKITK